MIPIVAIKILESEGHKLAGIGRNSPEAELAMKKIENRRRMEKRVKQTMLPDGEPVAKRL